MIEWGLGGEWEGHGGLTIKIIMYLTNHTVVVRSTSLFSQDGLSVHWNIPAFHLARALVHSPKHPPFGYQKILNCRCGSPSLGGRGRASCHPAGLELFQQRDLAASFCPSCQGVSNPPSASPQKPTMTYT